MSIHQQPSTINYFLYINLQEGSYQEADTEGKKRHPHADPGHFKKPVPEIQVLCDRNIIVEQENYQQG